MNISFILKESFDGFRRARMSSLLSTVIISFLLILIAVFFIATTNLDRLIEVMHAGVDMEIFIDDTLDDKEIANLEKEIKGIEGVANIEFISKTAAAKVFQKEFGDEIFDILDDNPLPSSFKVEIDWERSGSEDAESIVAKTEKLHGVSEVVYRRGTLDLLEKYARAAYEIDIFLGVFVGLGSILIVYNTIRLIILAQKNVLEAMELVGATRWFVRCPFIIEGGIQGLLGGLIASGVVAVAVKMFSLEIPSFLIVEAFIYNMLIVIGLLLGITGSFLATRKYID